MSPATIKKFLDFCTQMVSSDYNFAKPFLHWFDEMDKSGKNKVSQKYVDTVFD